MTHRKPLPADMFDELCPSSLLPFRFGDKWAALIIRCLEGGPRRFSELRVPLHSVTPKVLTQSLRLLERGGLVSRTVHAGPSDLVMATVRLNAGEFHYVSYGDRAGMPLVLLHGMPSDCSTWAQVAPDLAAVGYQVITPDQRGHGGSARTGTYSLEEMREDVRQLADALGLGRFVLGGHSMGGTVATLFAERYPGRLAGLILVDTPPPDGSASYDPGPRPDGDLPYD